MKIPLTNGKYFNILSPETSEYDIHVIAVGLSKACRWSGQCDGFFSVAQHSVIVSHAAESKLGAPYAMVGLLHDAAEAFVHDISAPLKGLVPGYNIIEARIQKDIFRRFDLDIDDLPTIKEMDQQSAKTEFEDLFTQPAPSNLDQYQRLPYALEPVDWREAYDLFMNRYRELQGA